MKGLEIPEKVELWEELSQMVKRDLVAISRIQRQPIKRILVEAVLLSIEALTDGHLNRSNEYKEEFDGLELLKDE